MLATDSRLVAMLFLSKFIMFPACEDISIIFVTCCQTWDLVGLWRKKDMAVIRKRANKWYIDYYDENGKRVVKPVSRDKSTAEKVCKEIEVKKYLGELPKPKMVVAIRDAAEEYYRAMVEIRRPKTIRTSKGRLYNLIDYWEDKGIVNLSDIESRSLLKFRQEFLRDHTPLTYNHYIEVVKAFLNWIVRVYPEYLKVNPLAMAEKIKGAYSHKPRYFSKEQLQKIYEAIDNPDVLAFVRLAANVGYRPNELRFQQWENVNLKNRFVTIAPYPKMGFQPKDFEIGTIPLNNSALEVYKSLERKGPLVFDNGEGKPLYNEWYWNKKFKKALERAKIKNGCLYDLRHTFGVHHILAGTSPFILQKLMGHADITTTMLYVNLTDSDIKAHAKNIDL
jgi:integrase